MSASSSDNGASRIDGAEGFPDAVSELPGVPIDDVRAYLERLLSGGSAVAQLDRSAYFRYPQDAQQIAALMRKRASRPEPLSVEIIGVANAEEALSYLAACASVLPEGTHLADRVGLRLIDVRPRDAMHVRYGLGKIGKGGLGAAFLGAASQVELVPRKPPEEYAAAYAFDAMAGEYRFRPDVQSTLEAALSDPAASRLGVPVENDLVANPREQCDVVACNNVLQHLGAGTYETPYRNDGLPPERYARFVAVLRGIVGRVAPGGLLILHTDGATIADTKGRATAKALALLPEFDGQFEQIASGIYRRRDGGKTTEGGAGSSGR
jgi:hypothetical protein